MNNEALFIANALVFGGLFVVWSRNSWLNTGIKTVLFAATVLNIIAVLR